jgi:hypothetical protein
MDAPLSCLDERMMAELEVEARPLVAAVREALADLLTCSGKDTLNRLLAAAPVEACVRLADVWTMAQALGVPTDRVKDRFGPEDQFLIEFVTTVYAPPQPGTPTEMPALGGLIDETAEPVG